MKKYFFTFLTIILALFMVACDPSTPSQNEDQPESPEEPVTPPEEVVELNAPSWAIGTFYGTGDMNGVSLAIEKDAFSFSVQGGDTISSINSELKGSNGIEAETSGEWTVTLATENESYTINIVKTEDVGHIKLTVEGIGINDLDLYTDIPTEDGNFIPIWAKKGTYDGLIGTMPATLTINQDSIAVKVLTFDINSGNDVNPQSDIDSDNDGIWNIKLNGFKVVETDTELSTADVVVTQNDQDENKLSVKVNLAGRWGNVAASFLEKPIEFTLSSSIN